MQDPLNSQSLNRYSYVLNNPMTYTDPTGYFSVGDGLRLVATAVIAWYAPYLASYLGGGFGGAVAAGAISGFAAGAVQTGNLKGAVNGAVSGAVFGGIGASLPAEGSGALYESGRLSTSGYAVRALTSGVAGGVLSTMQGGRFGAGFASAGLGSALTPVAGYVTSNSVGQGFLVAIVGGTASAAGGWKFANGAMSAAFSYAFGRVAGSRSGISDQASSSDGWFESFTTRTRVNMFFPELADPKLLAEFRDAWADSIPGDMRLRHEEGGYWGLEGDGSYGVRRFPAGNRDSMGGPMPYENGVYQGLTVKGLFHTHPSPRPIDEFGIRRNSAPSGGDFGVIREWNFPGRSYIIDNKTVIYQVKGNWGVVGSHQSILGR